LDHAGPIARGVDDLALVYLALAEPSAAAANVEEALQQSGPTNISPWEAWQMLRQAGPSPAIAVLEHPFMEQAAVDVRKVTRHVLRQLAVDSPATLPSSFADVYRHHRCIMAADAAKVHAHAFASDPQSFAPKIAALIAEGQAVSLGDYQRACDHQSRFRVEIESLFVGRRLVALPSTNTVAPHQLDTTGDPAFNSPWSYAGLPSVTIPCGVNAKGMPCGLQLLGPPQSELRLLRAARWCEEQIAFQGYPRSFIA
jgi:aspartyl-tRNA(Asn)/glutamyl-tRNA(Gln) amidotransferase subunit A